MPFNWKAIKESRRSDKRLYRLIGEMLHKKATPGDIVQIQKFLSSNGAGAEAWHTLGEALYRTTDGSQLGLRLWSTWSRTLDEVPQGTVLILDQWKAFGEPIAPPAPSVDDDDDDEPATDVVEIEIPDSFSSSMPSNTAMIRFPRPRLMEFVPDGAYTIRFLGEVYENADNKAIVRLLRRGLLLGAEVQHNDQWVAVAVHPAFKALAKVMSDEVRRVLEASSDNLDITNTNKMA